MLAEKYAMWAILKSCLPFMNSDEDFDAVDDVMEVGVEREADPAQDVQAQDGVVDEELRGRALATGDAHRKLRQSGMGEKKIVFLIF